MRRAFIRVPGAWMTNAQDLIMLLQREVLITRMEYLYAHRAFEWVAEGGRLPEVNDGEKSPILTAEFLRRWPNGPIGGLILKDEDGNAVLELFK